jgi:hypothetical protein
MLLDESNCDDINRLFLVTFSDFQHISDGLCSIPMTWFLGHSLSEVLVGQSPHWAADLWDAFSSCEHVSFEQLFIIKLAELQRSSIIRMAPGLWSVFANYASGAYCIPKSSLLGILSTYSYYGPTGPILYSSYLLDTIDRFLKSDIVTFDEFLDCIAMLSRNDVLVDLDSCLKIGNNMVCDWILFKQRQRHEWMTLNQDFRIDCSTSKCDKLVDTIDECVGEMVWCGVDALSLVSDAMPANACVPALVISSYVGCCVGDTVSCGFAVSADSDFDVVPVALTVCQDARLASHPDGCSVSDVFSDLPVYGGGRDTVEMDILGILEILGRVRCTDAVRRRRKRRCRLISATDLIKAVSVHRLRRRGRWRKIAYGDKSFRTALLRRYRLRNCRAVAVGDVIGGNDTMNKVKVFRRQRRGRWRQAQLLPRVTTMYGCSTHYGLYIRGRIIRHPDNDR